MFALSGTISVSYVMNIWPAGLFNDWGPWEQQQLAICGHTRLYTLSLSASECYNVCSWSCIVHPQLWTAPVRVPHIVNTALLICCSSALERLLVVVGEWASTSLLTSGMHWCHSSISSIFSWFSEKLLKMCADISSSLANLPLGLRQTWTGVNCKVLLIRAGGRKQFLM